MTIEQDALALLKRAFNLLQIRDADYEKGGLLRDIGDFVRATEESERKAAVGSDNREAREAWQEGKEAVMRAGKAEEARDTARAEAFEECERIVAMERDPHNPDGAQHETACKIELAIRSAKERK